MFLGNKSFSMKKALKKWLTKLVFVDKDQINWLVFNING